MGRRLVSTAAVVLRTRRLGETSKLVTLYTAACGKLKATAKGARRPGSRLGPGLELFHELQVVCYVRDERDLQTLSECDVLVDHADLLQDLERLAYGSAACELIDRLTLEGEANPRLYACLTGVLTGLGEVAPEQREPLFWYYQLRVAAALGFRPQLQSCAACGGQLEGARVAFSAACGGCVCSTCGTNSGTVLPGSAWRWLAQLQALRTYSAAAIPSVPASARQIRAALDSFLAFHGGGHGPLRALDYLDVRPAAPAAPAGTAAPRAS